LRRLTGLLLALLCFILLMPTGALAQGSDWSERRTERFAILYTSGDEATAEQYAGFVDAIYDEIAAVFGHRTSTPIKLRLYPSIERYYEANPLARGMPGIVAHADFRRHEVVVIVPQTATQTPDEIQNNIRHELTHIVAAELSEDRLNTGFQEGIAQYAEHPSRELEMKIRLLREYVQDDRLLSWSDLDDRDIVYRNPNASYPQSLSIVAFLIERYSFAKLRDFLTFSARSSGYRSALEHAFGATPDELEQQWRAWLPEYLNGGYRHNVLTAYDLSRAEDLLRQGRYVEAQTELEDAINWLRTTNQTAVLDQARALLERSTAGQGAEALANQARGALEAADYALAADLVNRAREAYAGLEDTRQAAVLTAYAERAERGLRAAAALDEAHALASRLRYPQARAMADHAAAEFTSLGDRARADQAQALRAFLDQRQTLLGAVLLILGLGGVVGSTVRRLTVREAEAW
jgi:Peptidase MA superfamily